MHSDRWNLELAPTDAHLAAHRTGMSMLLQILLIQVTLQGPIIFCLCWADCAQIKSICQVEVGYHLIVLRVWLIRPWLINGSIGLTRKITKSGM